MTHFRNIFRFGWPYLRRYWARLFLGVILGVVFGFSSALILRSGSLVFNRIAPSTAPAPAKKEAKADWFGIKAKASAAQARIESALDPWLPLTGRKMDAQQRLGLLLLLPALFAFRGFVGYFSSYFMGWVSERVINDMRLDVLVKLNSLSLDFFNRSTMGDLLTRINSDTSALQRSLNLGFSDLIKEPITVIGIFGVLVWTDPMLTLLVLIFLPLCGIPIAILGKKARRASQGGVKATVSQASQLVELLSSIRVVKAFGLEAEQVERFRNFSRTLIHHGMKGIQARELVNPLIETIAAFGLGLLIVFVFQRERNLQNMVIFLAGVASVYTPLKKLASLHILFQQTSIGVDRLIHILTEQPSVREPAVPRPISEFAGQIAFENVTFAYGEKPVLSDVTLSIRCGTRVGIAGESGSGKSTLLNLLFRFYDPTSGAVKIDGRDIRDFSLKELRQLMALVSQEIVLFDLTVAENIALGKKGAGRNEVEEAARGAFAHEFILQLPQGYDTRVGERGVTLSGGQRQRIAIARAFIRDAPILVLDEATASLDSQAEAEVQAAIERLSEHRTVFCVAHRLSTLANLDRIIVLSNGRIIQDGSFEELLEADGVFARMARKQGLSGKRTPHQYEEGTKKIRV